MQHLVEQFPDSHFGHNDVGVYPLWRAQRRQRLLLHSFTHAHGSCRCRALARLRQRRQSAPRLRLPSPADVKSPFDSRLARAANKSSAIHGRERLTRPRRRRSRHAPRGMERRHLSILHPGHQLSRCPLNLHPDSTVLRDPRDRRRHRPSFWLTARSFVPPASRRPPS